MKNNQNFIRRCWRSWRWLQARSRGQTLCLIWADGVYFTPRLDGGRRCAVVIIGADAYGEQDVLATMDRFRENADRWRDLLTVLKQLGLTVPLELATGDGTLGLWTALRDVVSTKREHQCQLYEAVDATGLISN